MDYGEKFYLTLTAGTSVYYKEIAPVLINFDSWIFTTVQYLLAYIVL